MTTDTETPRRPDARLDRREAAHDPATARESDADGTPGDEPGTDVRDAGTEEMKLKPRKWSDVDEAADASFPASDPPGGY